MSAAMKASETLWGKWADDLARTEGGWPDGAMVHSMAVLNPTANIPDDKRQIRMSGGVPIGRYKDGRPKFGPMRDSLEVVVSLAKYRAASASAKIAEGVE